MKPAIQDLGPWAVITGASSGIGEAFAHHLAGGGINLVLVARSAERLHSVGSRLSREFGIEHRTVPIDLSTPSGALELARATEDLDVGILVSNAGDGSPGRFLDQDVEQMRKRLTLNAASHSVLAYEFGQRFVDRGRGGIVLVSALGSPQGLPNMAHDGATKAYVNSLGQALHRELAPAGVTVTVMLPGNVDTPVIDRLGIDRARLPMSPLPVERAVEQTLDALRSGKAAVIPDRRMRWLTRLTPDALVRRINGRMLGQAADNLRAAESIHDGM